MHPDQLITSDLHELAYPTTVVNSGRLRSCYGSEGCGSESLRENLQFIEQRLSRARVSLPDDPGKERSR